MKKILFLFILYFMSVLYVKGQMPLMKSVTGKVNALKQAGVDTIVTYHPYCVGCLKFYEENAISTCHSFDKQYVIWKEKGESYVQLFDECYAYLPQKGVTGFTALLSKNFKAIMQEKILPVVIEKKVNGKTEKFFIGIDHSFHRNFTFFINGRTIEKPIDTFELDSRWEDDYFSSNTKQKVPPPGKGININYAKNQKTYLKKLLNLAELEVEKMKFKKAR